LTHGIEPGDIQRGALALASSVPFSAPAVHLAVVDPGVGTERRALALAAGEHFLVGPDNGLLWLAAERLGGIDEVVEISDSPFRLEPTHRTFHGRDIFSPVAARLASGVPVSEAGDPIEPDSVIPLDLPRPRLDGELLVGHVIAADRYGNLVLNVTADLIERSFLTPGTRVAMEAAGPVVAEIPVGETFGDVDPGEPVLYPDSSGSLALAVNRGDAGAEFALAPGDEISLSPLT
jgi:S-adenosylmethionine hydrolase